MTTDPPKVLLADDDPAIRPLIAAICKRLGFVCDTAEDGEVALEKIRSEEYDLVVVDLMMPKVNGFQVIEVLRELPRRPAVIVLTAQGPAEKIRGEVHLRFPALSNQQLKNIVVGSTVLTMRDESNREEVHLYVDIYENPRIVNSDEVQNYVADLFEQELRRQMAAAGLSATSSSSP